MPPTSGTPEVRGTSARLTSPHAPNLVHPGGSGHQRAADEPPCPQPPTGPTETGVSAPGTARAPAAPLVSADPHSVGQRSEEHTSELQSLMRSSYAVFCLKKKNKPHNTKI